MKNLVFTLIMCLSVFGCKIQHRSSSGLTDNTSTQLAMQSSETVQAHVVIYKTVKDYLHNVPVILSDDKTQIISYPHPSDLFIDKKLALPVKLHQGYLLDNRGIHVNTAFLKYTYKEYSKFKDAPTMEELLRNIIDKEPLMEIWDCGNRSIFTNLQEQLNDWIDKNLLPETCKRIS